MKVGTMPIPVNVVRATLSSRRGNADERLYARATPEKIALTETYSITQEIAQNSRSEPGLPTGRIEMVIPYDGGNYFTRHATRPGWPTCWAGAQRRCAALSSEIAHVRTTPDALLRRRHPLQDHGAGDRVELGALRDSGWRDRVHH